MFCSHNKRLVVPGNGAEKCDKIPQFPCPVEKFLCLEGDRTGCNETNTECTVAGERERSAPFLV